MEVTARHVERALAGESPQRTSLLDDWRKAARAFVIEVENRRRGGQQLSLDMLDAFRGLVLEEAQQGRTAVEALKLLGLDRDVESRNQHRTVRWGREKVDALKRALAEPGSLSPPTPPPSSEDAPEVSEVRAPRAPREARK